MAKGRKRRELTPEERRAADPWTKYIDPNGDWWEQQGWVTPEKMAKRLQVSVREVYRLWKEGILIRGLSKESGVRFSLRALETYLYTLDEWDEKIPKKPK